MMWTANTPVLLYGAAHRGTVISRYLRTDCNIIGFIDRRAAEIVIHEGIPVFNLAEVERCALVIVCVNNIFEHESIALNLASEGFTAVIFCPVDGSNMVWKSDEDRMAMTRLYSDIIEERLTLPASIPGLNGLFYPAYKDDALIEVTTDGVLAWIPALFAFARRNGNGIFKDSPVLTLFPYLELFRWFDGEIDSTPNHYIDLYCRNAAEQFGISQTVAWVENVLKSRRQVYERMRQTDSIDHLFFVRQAVKADWNVDESHFNMDSGKHRAAFLIHRKRPLVPLKLSSADYENYLNRPALDSLLDHMKQTHVSELPYPVMHSYFLKTPYRAEGAYHELLLKLCRSLVLANFKNTGRVSLKDVSLWTERAELEPLVQALAVLGCSIKYGYQASVFDLKVRQLYRISGHFTRQNAAMDKCDFLLDEWVTESCVHS